MNRRLRQRLQHHGHEQATMPARSHSELVAQGRALGLPPFCGSWPTETLKQKVKELENGSN